MFNHLLEFTKTETFMLVSFVLVVGLSLAVGLIFQKIIFNYLRKITRKTKTQLDDIILYSIRSPFILWCLILGISLGLKTTKLPKPTIVTIDKILLSLWVISAIIVALRIITQFIKVYGKRFETTIPLTSVTQNAAKLAVAVIGILVLLKTLGIAITPILTTLGIGGLAVALALQDTLSNLFSGIYIAAGKQIRIGDYIELESGQSGYVIDIGWRATRIRQLPNNIIIIPNAKLSQTIITNYFLPEKEIKVYVQVGVHYDSDLEKVERVTIDVAKETLRDIDGGVTEFNPVIRYHTFDSSSINFTVVLRSRQFADKYLLTHEFIKRLKKRYDKERIVIPFPITTVHLQK